MLTTWTQPDRSFNLSAFRLIPPIPTELSFAPG